jgi:hypothetical protein
MPPFGGRNRLMINICKNKMFSKKVKLDLNYLEMTPQRLYEHETRDDGLINVLVPKFHTKFYKKYIMPKMKNPYIRANLDEFGSRAWELADGSTPVREIVALMEERFGERLGPATERITMFLTQLYKAGFISFKELNRKV